MTVHKHGDEVCDSDDPACPYNKARTEMQLAQQRVCADPQCDHPAYMHVSGRCSYMPTPGYHCRCAAYREPAPAPALGSAIESTNDVHHVERRFGADRREAVNHPSHYGGDTTYEVVKVLDAWGLDRDFYLGNTVKYIARAGKKDPAKTVEDLEKSRWYLDRAIARAKRDV